MKIFLFISIFCTTLFATPLLDHNIDPDTLNALLSALNVEGDLVESTQKHWLRAAEKERWEMQELKPDQKSLVLNWAEKHGFFANWSPSYKSYHAAVILGGTTPRMKQRLEYLKQLWDEGVRFEEVVWLTGERPLDEKIDSFFDRCATEGEASQLLWQEALLPSEMQKLPLSFISAKMKHKGSSLLRPNREDTLLAWMNTNPSARFVLFISNQPFCNYEFAMLKSILPPDFLFELVGPGCDPAKHPAMAAVILDSLARQIYQENLKKTTPSL